MEVLNLNCRKDLVMGIANGHKLAGRALYSFSATRGGVTVMGPGKANHRRLSHQPEVTPSMLSLIRRSLQLAIGLAFLAPVAAQAQVYQQPGWDWGWGFGHMAFGSLMMLLFWGIIIVLIVFAVRWIGAGPHGGSTTHPPRRTPREILEERFARGEIDKEEFEERRRLLSD